MFRIKGQVQISHLSKLQANRLKSQFRDKVIPILSFYRIQNQILSRQSHSNTSIYQTCRRIQTKISFSRHGSIQYFHFTKYKTKQVHISCLQQGTSRDKFKLAIYQTSRHGSFQYFHFTKYETIQVHISCFASRDIEENDQPSYLSNL